MLLTLIDLVYELTAFRNFLNQRIEEKTGYNKQKMEMQSQIKQLELEQQTLVKKQQESDEKS